MDDEDADADDVEVRTAIGQAVYDVEARSAISRAVYELRLKSSLDFVLVIPRRRKTLTKSNKQQTPMYLPGCRRAM